jgi:hypothetical protein
MVRGKIKLLSRRPVDSFLVNFEVNILLQLRHEYAGYIQFSESDVFKCGRNDWCRELMVRFLKLLDQSDETRPDKRLNLL